MLLFTATAQAHEFRGGWGVPFVVGAGVGYLATRPYYPTYYAQPVYYTPPPPQVVYVQQPNPAPGLPVGYHWQYILDNTCDCYKYAMVPN